MNDDRKRRIVILREWEVHAILGHRLSLLVRPVEPQPTLWRSQAPGMEDIGGLLWKGVPYEADAPSGIESHCPYGQPGDVLHCLEAWWSDWREPGVVIYDATPEWGKYQNEPKPIRATFPDGIFLTREESRLAMLPKFWSPRQAETMPDWAVRLTLKVTGNGIGRMNEMSEREHRAAGFGTRRPGRFFRARYDQDYGAGASECNDWLWKIPVMARSDGSDDRFQRSDYLGTDGQAAVNSSDLLTVDQIRQAYVTRSPRPDCEPGMRWRAYGPTGVILYGTTEDEVIAKWTEAVKARQPQPKGGI